MSETDVWQCEAYQTSPYQAAMRFAQSYFDKPRDLAANLTEDGKFSLIDGCAQYQVRLIPGVKLVSVPVYRIFRLG